MKRHGRKFFVGLVVLSLLSISDSYAQHYGKKFIIAPNYYFNHFTIDKIGQQIYADLYGGRVYRVDLRTMEVDTAEFADMAPVFGSPVFGNKKHLMFWGGTLLDMDTGSLYKLPIPDNPEYVGSLYYMFPILFSPNDGNLMFSLISPTPPYLVNGYIFSLKDSSLTQIDTSVNFTAESNGELIPQWSSDTSFIYGTSDSCLVEYFIGSKRVDTLVMLHNYGKITSFACNTKENFLAYGSSIWVAPNFSERIYFHYKDSTSDVLAFSLADDSTCNSLAIAFEWLCWSPDNERLGFIGNSAINGVADIYFYSSASERTYRVSQCGDPDYKYALQWANEDTLIYYDADDGHLYGMDISNVDAIRERKDESLPLDFGLSAYPNPFNPSTSISYQLSAISLVTLKVYDVLGKEVVTLISHEKQTAGTHTIQWSATNRYNQKVASGFYFAVLRIDGSKNQNTKVTKLIHLK
jgi:FlgD Ig-like domain